ncbi:MAG: hypothetical protein GXP28_04505 [Planctomycetes bacterium]|nr:hypothetical protein [Planctomycetota bacterium]
MQTADILVLIGYFLVMLVIGAICALRVKKQEDYFMGGRGFGKLLQTFAAFGAGTGSQEPINVGRTTWTSGLSGVWSALMWLFVTPFYWIFAIWYRRMRHHDRRLVCRALRKSSDGGSLHGVWLLLLHGVSVDHVFRDCQSGRAPLR